MGNLTERVNGLYELYQKKQKMKALLRKHRDIVERADFHGFLPRVYLIGEDHTQEDHIKLAIEAVEILSPEALLYESIARRIDPGQVRGTTFEGILEEYDLGMYRPAILEIIPEIEVEKLSILKSENIDDRNNEFYEGMFGKKEAENLRKIKEYQKDPSKILSEPTYFLSHDAYCLFLDAYKKLIQKENEGKVTEIRKILAGKPVTGDADFALFELSGFLDFPSTYCDFKKVYNALIDPRLENTSSERIKKMVDLYLKLKTEEMEMYNILMIDEPKISGQTKYVKHLGVVCGNKGVTIYPFDHQEAKEQLLANLKQKHEIDAMSKDERKKYNELILKIDTLREMEMERILLESASDTKGIILTYGGRDHIDFRTCFDAPVVDKLNRNKIPYCRILLKANDKKPAFVRNIEYIGYLQEQRRIEGIENGL